MLDGASDLLVDVFGAERGARARAAPYQHDLAADAPVAGRVLLAVHLLGDHAAPGPEESGHGTPGHPFGHGITHGPRTGTGEGTGADR